MIEYRKTGEDDRWVYSDYYLDKQFMSKTIRLKELPKVENHVFTPEEKEARIWAWRLETEALIPGFFKKTAVEKIILERYPNFYDE